VQTLAVASPQSSTAEATKAEAGCRPPEGHKSPQGQKSKHVCRGGWVPARGGRGEARGPRGGVRRARRRGGIEVIGVLRVEPTSQRRVARIVGHVRQLFVEDPGFLGRAFELLHLAPQLLLFLLQRLHLLPPITRPFSASIACNLETACRRATLQCILRPCMPSNLPPPSIRPPTSIPSHTSVKPSLR
jgi:hypothetical protein